MVSNSIQRIMSGYGSLQGLLAVNKPSGITSAGVIRELQRVFKSSPVFFESLELERKTRLGESGRQRQKRRGKRGPVEVKMGHGGTLDPMATGVLIIGINDGTKHLKQFLDCSKSYDCVALFGCSTDTYDAEGKIMRRAPYKHITRQAVEDALNAFHGNILQKPPIYSALHQNGMRLYEYARKGIPLPMEIKARPVTVASMELLDFTTDHTWEFPAEELTEEDKVVGRALNDQVANPSGHIGKAEEKKHAREEDVEAASLSTKKSKLDMVDEEITPATQDSTSTFIDVPTAATEEESRPAAVSIRMTVTSGFYVRSLVHDLGEALGSAAHMVKLVRTSQADFKLGENVIEWEDLVNPDTTVWEGKVVKILRAWSDKQYGSDKKYGTTSRSINISRSLKEEGQACAEAEAPKNEEVTAEDKNSTNEVVEGTNSTVAKAHLTL